MQFSPNYSYYSQHTQMCEIRSQCKSLLTLNNGWHWMHRNCTSIFIEIKWIEWRKFNFNVWESIFQRQTRRRKLSLCHKWRLLIVDVVDNNCSIFGFYRCFVARLPLIIDCHCDFIFCCRTFFAINWVKIESLLLRWNNFHFQRKKYFRWENKQLAATMKTTNDLPIRKMRVKKVKGNRSIKNLFSKRQSEENNCKNDFIASRIRALFVQMILALFFFPLFTLSLNTNAIDATLQNILFL